MKFDFKKYQLDTVEELIGAIRSLLEIDQSSRIIFKSPTGSGKTVMIAETLRALLQESLPGQYVFIWISFYQIHLQSHDKLKSIS